MPRKIQLPQQFFFLFFSVVLFKYIIQLINDSDRSTRQLDLYAVSLDGTRYTAFLPKDTFLFHSASIFILIPSSFHFLLFLLCCLLLYSYFFPALLFLHSQFLFLALFSLFRFILHIFLHFPFFISPYFLFFS